MGANGRNERSERDVNFVSDDGPVWKLKVEKAIGQWACLFCLPRHKISLPKVVGILTLETLQ